MTLLYVLVFALLFSINGVVLSSILLVVSAPMYVLNGIYSGARGQYYQMLPLFIILTIWCAYIVFNNSINGLPLQMGVLWWFAILFFLLFFPAKNVSTEATFFLLVSIIILSIDLVYRISFVNVTSVVNNYYVMKKNSLIGVDSNIAGLYSSICFSILFASRRYLSKRIFKIICASLVFLLVMSFSKVAIISVIVLLAYVYSPRWIFVFMSFFLVAAGVIFLLGNESGLSKIELLQLTVRMLSDIGSNQYLFGSGFGSVLFSTNDLTPHVLFLQLILYLGVFGLLLYLGIWLGLFHYVGTPLLYLLIPYSIISLSFTPIGFPPLAFAILFFCRYRRELS